MKTEEYQKYVGLILDEVKVKEGLVYNKESMEIIGIVDVGDLSKQLKLYEMRCTQEEFKPQVATHILMFMVRGLFSSLCFPYAQFPCSSLTGDQLYPITITYECISHLEMLGFKVLTMTCDGVSCNRRLISMLQPSKTKENADELFKIDNIFASESRPIFIFSDVPHLIKTTRNCWANSFAHKRSRKLWVRNQSVMPIA